MPGLIMSDTAWGVWADTRADNLRFLDEAHVSAVDAAARFEVTEEHLEKWCRDHQLRAVWLRMNRRNPCRVEVDQ